MCITVFINNIHENRHSSDGNELIQSTLDKTCSLLGQLYRLSDYETEMDDHSYQTDRS